MLDFNDIITFTRSSNVLVDSWSTGPAPSISLSEPAYLEVSFAGTTSGTLMIQGTDENNTNISESISFDSSATFLSTNQYKSIAGLTPSWSTFTISIKAVTLQGGPIMNKSSFGPYPCSTDNSSIIGSPPGVIGVPGMLPEFVWRVSILAFEPIEGDYVETGKGRVGFVSDPQQCPLPNVPFGWIFFITEHRKVG